ncbi:MAG TPA: histidine kinase N-terminal 7TM domain-containing protein, partial [Actinomycetes bacterium]|nr:histidine kinase N-terminal 7TM domain-containing protein [Actinomycetes bacterium]
MATLAAALLFAGLAAYVWRRRSGSAGAALALVLVAVLLWAGAYAVELGVTDLAAKQRWGDFKYVGICLLPPAWFAFAALFSGRGQWVNRRTMVLLSLEPLVVLALLANRATHDLVRWYPAGTGATVNDVAEAGPLFWPHLLYNNALIWTGTVLLVVALSRMSGLARRQSALLVAAILLPIILNLLFNLRVEPFRQVDLTPFAFVLSTAVLVWGVYQFSLLDLRPVARSQIFRTISDPVLVLDPGGRVLDANPAAGRLAGRPLNEVVGRPVTDVLPTWSEGLEITLDGHIYDLAISALPERQRQPGGHLVVARDVTERRQVEERLCAALNHERVATDRLAVALERERAVAERLRA